MNRSSAERLTHAALSLITAQSSDALIECFAHTRALYQMYQFMHWKTSGVNYYGDHLLYQRLYEGVQGEIDTLAEKIIGISGDSATLDPLAHIERTLEVVRDHFEGDTKPDDYPDTAIAAEKDFIKTIEAALKNTTTDGVENLLQGMVDKHEEHLYLLQQRSS